MQMTNRLNMITEFNNKLPVEIEVKKEINPIRYLLQVGNKSLETKSYTTLEVGKRYFGELTQQKESLTIKNLVKIPEFFKVLEMENETFMPKETIKYKETLLEKLSNAPTKEQFIFFTQLFLAYNQGIYHLIINEERKAVMQLRYKEKKIKFFAIFQNLGALEGELFLNKTLFLHLRFEFESSRRFVSEYINELTDFEVTLSTQKTTPLYNFSQDSLLNLKG